MKKLLSILLAALTAFALTSCAGAPEVSVEDISVSGYADTAETGDEPELITESGAAQTAETLAEASAVTENDQTGGESTSAAPESSGHAASAAETAEQPNAPPAEDGSYSSRDDVALYIHTYGRLPGNFITKSEARELGWSGGSVEQYAPGMCIGGDRFGNYEGLLPEKKGRTYTECDIDTLGQSSRGAKRIIFSNDGLIYYTDDHYASFTLLYGEE